MLRFIAIAFFLLLFTLFGFLVGVNHHANAKIYLAKVSADHR